MRVLSFSGLVPSILRIIWVTGSFCYLAITPLALRAEDPCHPSAFAQFKNQNAYFPYQNPAYALSESSPFHSLGGYTGGVVYLVRISEGKTRVAKIYYQTTSLRRDTVLLETWRNLAVVQKRDLGFQVVNIERPLPNPAIIPNPQGNPVMTMRFVRGRTVHSLLLDESLPALFRERLRTAYLARLNRFREAMLQAGARDVQEIASTSGIYEDHIVDGIPQLRGSLNAQPFIIKSDNIIVDPETLEMTIVDPH